MEVFVMGSRLLQGFLLVIVFAASMIAGLAFTADTQLTLTIYPQEYAQGKTDATCFVKADKTAGGGLQDPPGSGEVKVFRVSGIDSTTIIDRCWTFTFSEGPPSGGTSSTELDNNIPNIPGTYYYRAKFTRSDGDGGYEGKWSNNTVVVHVLMVEITDNLGNIITSKHTTCIGRPVDLHTELFPTILGPVTSQWTLPGSYIKNYTTSGSAAVLTDMTNSDKAGTNVYYYWTKGANDQSVQYRCTYDTASMWDSAQFDIQEPTIAITRVNTGTALFIDEASSKGLSSGDFSATPIDVGMDIKAVVTSPSLFDGQFRFTQTVNSLRQTKPVGGVLAPISGCDTGGEYWLDTRVYYAGPFNVNKGVTETDSTDDTPLNGVNAAIEELRVTDQFRMYVMYKPTVETNDIWVPIGVLTWGWHGTTTTTDAWVTHSNANLGQDATTIKVAPGNYPEFPEWDNTIGSP
jgi:hypothetical protein